jgi:uncharacterized membrane-anchored protein YhcB (DUF1043 family)
VATKNQSEKEEAVVLLRPENANKKYEALFLEIDSGQIKLPMFQREFVWDKEQSAKLIDSILKGYQFLQTLAHEMLHVNETIPRRLLSNSFRMGNPLGYYHRKLDDVADEMVTQKLIEKYTKARNANKDCTCR